MSIWLTKTHSDIIFNFASIVTQRRINSYEDIIDDPDDSVFDVLRAGTQDQNLFTRSVAIFSRKASLGNQSGSLGAEESRVKQVEQFMNAGSSKRAINSNEIQPLLRFMETQRRMRVYSYADCIIKSKRSSSSSFIRGMSQWEYVMTRDLDDVLQDLLSAPKVYSAGYRFDKRGKVRTIFSMPAPVRVAEDMFIGDTYDITSKHSPWSQMFIEGLTINDIWLTLAKLAKDGVHVNTDFSGYESTMCWDDLMTYWNVLGKAGKCKDGFIKWVSTHNPVRDPQRGIIIPRMNALASGHKITHVVENVKQMCRRLEALRSGINIIGATYNGDDNVTKCETMKDAVGLINLYEKAGDRPSAAKSLIGEHVTLNRLHCNKWLPPQTEVYTDLITIFESEHNLQAWADIETSRFSAMYGSLIRLIISMIKMRFSEKDLIKITEEICVRTGIQSYGIPVNISELHQIATNRKHHVRPKGLESVKSEMNQAGDLARSLGVPSHSAMIEQEWYHGLKYSLQPIKVTYDKGIIIAGGVTYDTPKLPVEIPYFLEELWQMMDPHEDPVKRRVRLILQSARTPTISSSNTYEIRNIYELSEAINDREVEIWHRFIQQT